MRVIEPVEWNIKIKKLGDSKYELYYEEHIVKPDYVSFEDFEKSIGYTEKMLEKFEHLKHTLVKITDNSGKMTAVKFCTVLEGKLEDIANAILFEFLSFSSVGNVRIRDIIVSSVYGAFKMFGEK